MELISLLEIRLWHGDCMARGYVIKWRNNHTILEAAAAPGPALRAPAAAHMWLVCPGT